MTEKEEKGRRYIEGYIRASIPNVEFNWQELEEPLLWVTLPDRRPCKKTFRKEALIFHETDCADEIEAGISELLKCLL